MRRTTLLPRIARRCQSGPEERIRVARMHAEAKANGVLPGNYEAAQPMISVVNDAIERTHRLTGLPRDEIVRRGLIRNEIPLYTIGAVPLPGLSNRPQ